MKKTLIIICALTGACAVAALSAFGARQGHATPSRAAQVTHASAKVARSIRLGAPSVPSQGVQELARDEGLAVGELREIAATSGAKPAAIFGAAKGTATCAYLTGGTGAVGGCMHLGTDLVVPRTAIVDGGTYIWGIAAEDVTGVQARVGGQAFHGSVNNGVFSVEIGDGSHGTPSIDLLVNTGTSTTTISLPGIPTPLPS